MAAGREKYFNVDEMYLLTANYSRIKWYQFLIYEIPICRFVNWYSYSSGTSWRDCENTYLYCKSCNTNLCNVGPRDDVDGRLG